MDEIKKIKLMGGLGNQMFQYAFARAYSLLNNEEVFLDVSFYNNRRLFSSSTFRRYELDEYNIKLKKHSVDRYTAIKRILNVRLSKPKTLIEDGLVYRSEYLNKGGWVDAVGYFQSEKYFKNFRKEILEDFSLNSNLTENSLSLLQSIENRQAVSVHIRRGDYLKNKNFSIHGTCSKDYYHSAVNFIKKACSSPVLVFFSDDIEWVKQNMHFDCEKIFVEENVEKKPCEDMYLMSRCSHNIIANSSFSWWGAWLNENIGKTVIAPKRWFADKSFDSKDIVPDSWIKI